MARVALEAYFLHEEQVRAFLDRAVAEAALERGQRMQLPAGRAFALTEALSYKLTRLGLPELQRQALEGSIEEGHVVGLQQAFYFRRAKERDKPGYEPIDFKCALNTDKSVTVTGSLNSIRCPVASGATNLSGRRNAYIVGTITSWDGFSVELRPMFAGSRSLVEDDFADPDWSPPSRRVYPSQVRQFADVNFSKRPTVQALDTLASFPEADVKQAFAQIIGESFIQLDWGGETSDLYTAQIFLSGSQVSSAWLLKGPGHRGPMTVAALGKRGDQIDRLYREPAELLVLQHHREIRAAVVNMMETYACDMRRPRRYMILDGADTARILDAYGLL